MQRQFVKILAGAHKNLSDFVFCKEVRLGSYARDSRNARGTEEGHRMQEEEEGAEEEATAEAPTMDHLRVAHLPPAAAVATALMSADPMRTTPWGRRVPYMITYGAVGDRLCDRAVHPEEMLLRGVPLYIDSAYYITKQIIPATSRVFSLLGIDVIEWYNSLKRPPAGMPRGLAPLATAASKQHPRSGFAARVLCLICTQPLPRATFGHHLSKGGSEGPAEVCPPCAARETTTQRAIVTAAYRIKAIEERQRALYESSQALCSRSVNGMAPLEGQTYCTSIHCAAFWLHVTVRQRDAHTLSRLRRLMDGFA